MFKKRNRAERLEVILEFLIFGIVIGVTEDVLAIFLVTGEPITWHIIGLVILIAIPFAVIGEVVADNFDFSRYLARIFPEKGARHTTRQ